MKIQKIVCLLLAVMCVSLLLAARPAKHLESTAAQSQTTRPNIIREQPIFWEHEGNRAVRAGKWKLVAKENEPWELYDIEVDRTELNNLVVKQPDKVKELAAQWDTWATRANILPH